MLMIYRVKYFNLSFPKTWKRFALPGFGLPKHMKKVIGPTFPLCTSNILFNNVELGQTDGSTATVTANALYHRHIHASHTSITIQPIGTHHCNTHTHYVTYPHTGQTWFAANQAANQRKNFLHIPTFSYWQRAKWPTDPWTHRPSTLRHQQTFY